MLLDVHFIELENIVGNLNRCVIPLILANISYSFALSYLWTSAEAVCRGLWGPKISVLTFGYVMVKLQSLN